MSAIIIVGISCTNESNDISEDVNAEILTSTQSNNYVTNGGGYKIGGGIKFTLGRTSRSCHGLGICRVNKVRVKINDFDAVWENVQDDPAAREYNSYVETNYGIRTINSEKSLVIEIYPHMLVDFIEKEGGENFIVEEDYVIEDEFSILMGLESGYTVRKGEYPLEYDEETNVYYLFF